MFKWSFYASVIHTLLRSDPYITVNHKLIESECEWKSDYEIISISRSWTRIESVVENCCEDTGIECNRSEIKNKRTNKMDIVSLKVRSNEY